MIFGRKKAHISDLMVNKVVFQNFIKVLFTSYNYSSFWQYGKCYVSLTTTHAHIHKNTFNSLVLGAPFLLSLDTLDMITIKPEQNFNTKKKELNINYGINNWMKKKNCINYCQSGVNHYHRPECIEIENKN